MKLGKLFLLVLAATLLFTGCKKDSISNKSDYQRSYDAWLDFKSSSGNSYRYTVRSSSWIGFAQETTVTVSNGTVIRRSYVLTELVQDTPPTFNVREEWIETGNEIGSHERGFGPVTLDEIYRRAKDEWLVKRPDVTYYFEANNSGMISSCGYVPNGCADDCFFGIYIKSIERF